MTRPDKAVAPIPDLVGRDFTAEAINVKWCGDLTEIPTDEGKLYLATVEDLASRRVPGFAIGEHHDAPLAKAVLCMAVAVRGGDVAGVIFHSDKGGEYTGDVFACVCDVLGVIQSMGRVGSALDNAAAESFNSTLEWELLARRHFATKDQAPRIAAFIDRYNHRRRHSTCEMLPPVAYEQVLADRTADRTAEQARPDRAANRPRRSPYTPRSRSDGINTRGNDRLHTQSATLHDFRGSPHRGAANDADVPICAPRRAVTGVVRCAVLLERWAQIEASLLSRASG